MLKQLCRRTLNLFRRFHARGPAAEVFSTAAPAADTAPRPTGYYTPVYDSDGLRTDPAVIHNHDFMKDPRFVAAYERGVRAQGLDQKYYWRVHVALWCAAHANKLDGDFVECGVWKGFLSSAIMRYLDWNALDKRFYLFDTFCGIDETQVTAEELQRLHLAHYRKHYLPNFEAVERNFAEFANVVLVRGSVPVSLDRVSIGPVSYLSLDMNNVTPEVQAAEYFWDRLVPGGVVLLDDYGFVSYEEQKKGFDRFARQGGRGPRPADGPGADRQTRRPAAVGRCPDKREQTRGVRDSQFAYSSCGRRLRSLHGGEHCAVGRSSSASSAHHPRPAVRQSIS